MHTVKEQAFLMKEAILKGDFNRIGEILDISWQNKKKMAEGISNDLIDKIYSTAIQAGATGGKISGAGGGGFMIFYTEESKRKAVISSLTQFVGKVKHYEFCKQGLTTWTIG